MTTAQPFMSTARQTFVPRLASWFAEATKGRGTSMHKGGPRGSSALGGPGVPQRLGGPRVPQSWGSCLMLPSMPRRGMAVLGEVAPTHGTPGCRRCFNTRDGIAETASSHSGSSSSSRSPQTREMTNMMRAKTEEPSRWFARGMALPQEEMEMRFRSRTLPLLYYDDAGIARPR